MGLIVSTSSPEGRRLTHRHDGVSFLAVATEVVRGTAVDAVAQIFVQAGRCARWIPVPNGVEGEAPGCRAFGQRYRVLHHTNPRGCHPKRRVIVYNTAPRDLQLLTCTFGISLHGKVVWRMTATQERHRG